MLEINVDPAYYKKPTLNVSKYSYADDLIINEPISPASYYIFYDPMYHSDIAFETNHNFYKGILKKEQYTNADKRWWKLRKIEGYRFSLLDITAQNAYETVFGTFDKLEKGSAKCY